MSVDLKRVSTRTGKIDLTLIDKNDRILCQPFMPSLWLERNNNLNGKKRSSLLPTECICEFCVPLQKIMIIRLDRFHRMSFITQIQYQIIYCPTKALNYINYKVIKNTLKM